MKLKFFIAGLAIVAGLASAVSCQDISKDLTALQDKVKSLESTVQNLQAKIDAGAVITSVTPSNSGIIITLSNGNKYEITNGTNGKDGKDGQDGTPGSVVTIGEDGNWYIDGVDTGLAAQGEDGVPGAFYVPNPETGCFDMFVWDPEKEEYVAVPTEIPFVAEGTLTAVYNPLTGVVTLYGIEGYEGGYEIGAKDAEAVTEITIQKLPAAATPYNFFSVKQLVNDAFGPNGEITFEEEKTIERPLEYIIKVNPVSAKLSDEDVQFVNSKGDVLDMLDITVEEYDDILVKSGNTGLYKVTASLKEYNKEAFEKATKTATGLINFAIKVGDAVSDFESKFGRSDNWAPANPFSAISASAGRIMIAGGENTAQNITALRNRNGENDYKWTAAPKVQSAIVKSGTGVNVAKDSRTGGAYLKVAVDEPIVISATTNEYRAFYVTLDSENVTDPSETVAWGAYTITGLNTLCYDGELTVTVSSKEAKDDIIGFRVYAVNWDGTYASPYGTAFYAIMTADASDPGEETEPIATVLTPKYNGDFNKTLSEAAAFDITKVPGTPVKATVTYDEIKINGTTITSANTEFEVVFVDNKGAKKIANNAAIAAADWAKVVGIKTLPKLTATNGYASYIDKQAYTGVIDFADANGVILAKIPVSMTKMLPTVAPDDVKAAFKLRSGVLNEKNVLDKLFNTRSATTAYNFMLSGAGDSKTYGRKHYYSKAVWDLLDAIANETDVDADYAAVADAGARYYYGFGADETFSVKDMYSFQTPAATSAFATYYNKDHYLTTFTGTVEFRVEDKNGNPRKPYHDETAAAPDATYFYGVEDILTITGTNNDVAINMGMGMVDNKQHTAVVEYTYGKISMPKVGGKATEVTVPVDQYDYYFHTPLGNVEWDWNWNRVGAYPANTAVPPFIACGITGIGAKNWDEVAPTHNARIQFYNLSSPWNNKQESWVWNSTTPTGTGSTYTYADWQKDSFKLNEVPAISYIQPATTAWIPEDYITVKDAKALTLGTNNLTGLGIAAAVCIPAGDKSTAYYFGDLTDTGAAKKADYRPIILTTNLGEEYYEAENTAAGLGNFQLKPVAGAVTILSKVPAKLTIKGFDAFGNEIAVNLDVNILP